jgi:hypothetical protein
VSLLDYHVLHRVSELERVCVCVSERESVCVSARLPRCTFTILEDVHLYILVYVYATCIHFFFSRIKRGGCIAFVCVCMFACLAVCRCMCVYIERQSFFFPLPVFFSLFPPLFLRDVFFLVCIYMYVCMFVCIYDCIHVCVAIHVCMHTHISGRKIDLYVCDIYIYIYTYIYITFIVMYIIYIYIYYIAIYTYIYIYINIYVYTYAGGQKSTGARKGRRDV